LREVVGDSVGKPAMNRESGSRGRRRSLWFAARDPSTVSPLWTRFRMPPLPPYAGRHPYKRRGQRTLASSLRKCGRGERI
jgi:hypothetical protein